MSKDLAGRWELYSDMKGAGAAAKKLESAYNKALKGARAALGRGEHPMDAANAAIKDMMPTMKELDDFGALDTEPRAVLRERLEKDLHLEAYSLA